MGTACSQLGDTCQRLVTGKVDTCCFCCSLTQATIISGIVTIVVCAWVLFYLFNFLTDLNLLERITENSQKLEEPDEILIYFRLILLFCILVVALHLFFSGCLIYGCSAPSKRFMTPWIVITAFHLCGGICWSLLETFMIYGLHIFTFCFLVFCGYVWFCILALYRSLPVKVDTSEK